MSLPSSIGVLPLFGYHGRTPEKGAPRPADTNPGLVGGVLSSCEDPWEHEGRHRALARLPVEEQQVVFLKHFSELTFRAISKKVGASIGTAKPRYYRGPTLKASRCGTLPPERPRSVQYC